MAVMGCAEPVLGCLNQRSRVWAFRGPVWERNISTALQGGPWSWWPGDPGSPGPRFSHQGNNGPVLGNQGSQKPPPRSNGEHLTWSSYRCSWAPLRWQSRWYLDHPFGPHREYSWPLSLLMSFSPLMVQGLGPFSLFPQNRYSSYFLWNNLCLPSTVFTLSTHMCSLPLTATHTHFEYPLITRESDEWPSHGLPVVREHVASPDFYPEVFRDKELPLLTR